MSLPSLPADLTLAQWERQAGPLAKAKPTLVGDALRTLQKALELVDPRAFDADKLASVDEAEQRLAQCRSEAERKLKPLGQQAAAAAAAGTKWEASARKSAPKPALQAALAIGKAADKFALDLRGFGEAALAAIEARRDELVAAEQAAQSAKGPEDTPERRRLRTRVIDMFRIVKNRSDRRVMFLLCVGHTRCVPYMAPAISDAQKPLLTKVLRGDTGLKFFRGECIWEDGGYTFVGTRLSNTIARRIERGLLELTGVRYRIRAREGDARSKDEGEDA
jgi:hypothetical protein